MKKILINNVCFYPFNRVFEIDPSGEGEKQFKLSEAESKILEFLLENPGEYFGKEYLLSVGWGGRPVSSNSLPVAIANIRKLPSENLFSITNLTKVGYVLTPKENVLISVIPAALEVDETINSSTIEVVEDFRFTEVDDSKKLCKTNAINKVLLAKRLITYTITLCNIFSTFLLLYLYTDWIDIKCNVDTNRGYCYTTSAPHEIKWNDSNNFQLFVKSGELEKIIVLDKGK